MKLLEIVKGVIKRMIAPKTVESALHITPTISSKMKDAIELWEMMYKDESPWLTENVKSLGLPAMIASEKSRTATLEMDIKVTGDSERSKFVKELLEKLLPQVRKHLEFGIALGGLVIKPYVTSGVDGKYKLDFTFVNATNFYPLSFSADGRVTEAAFVDRILTKDEVFSKLEYHKLEGTTLTVRNMAFKTNNRDLQTSLTESELGTPIPLSSVSAWANIDPEVIINDIDTLLFAYFKMPDANNVDMDSPLGVSGFSRATSLIRQADEQYSNLLWEFEGGQLAIDVDRTALNPMRDSKGNTIDVLPKLQDRLYRRNLDLGDDDTYNVFSPALRDKNIINGLNTILMHIEDVCAISRGTLSEVTYAEARTATELKILKQRSFASNAEIQTELEHTLKEVVSIVDKYCDLYSIVPSGDFEVAYIWDDSIIVDKDAARQVDLLDVNNGLLSKIEYRMRWMGETEQQAEIALKRIEEEQREKMQMQQDIMAQNMQNNSSDNSHNTDSKSEAAAKHDKLNRANESNETTEKHRGPKDN